MQVQLDNGSIVEGFVDTGPLSAQSNGVTGVSGDLAPIGKWLGLPYGKAERWKRIDSSPSWTGVRKCLEYGPIPMQPLGVPLENVWDTAPGYHLRTHIPQSEDCLSCNVYKPANIAENVALPVFVFIYGGALRIGCSTKVRHDPTELIRQSERDGKPIVVVTFNYRVGIFGWLNHPDMSDSDGINGNFGLHDQLYFFRWLQRNVGRFGGDPAKITVMGNSAGAFSIAALMTRNRHGSTEELFRNVIFESGAPGTMSFRTQDSYFPYYDKLLAKAGSGSKAQLSERLAALRALSSQDLMEFEGQNFPFGNYGCTCETGPNAIFDAHPFEKLTVGDWDPKVEHAMLGCVESEGSLSGAPLKINTPQGHLDNFLRFPSELRQTLEELYPVNQEIQNTVIAPGNRLLAHHIFTGPAYHLAMIFATVKNKYTNHYLPIYVFRFNAPNSHTNPGAKWGVHHTSELAFVFNTNSLWPAGSPESKTAELVGQRWTDFIYTGKPGTDWPQFDSDQQVRLAIHDNGVVQTESVKEAPDYKQLEFWRQTLQRGGPYATRIFPLENEFGKAGLGETVCA